MAFTVPEFEAFAMTNSRIIMKMLKVFSNQMRRVHKQVSKLMAREEERPADGLFNVGDFYFRNKRFSQATYVFNRYLTYYPSGVHAIQAANNLELIERARRTGASIVSQVQSSADDNACLSAYSSAISLIAQGKYQEAIMAFKKIVDSNTDPEMTVKSSFEIGRCMFLMQKYDESLRYLTNVLTKYPKHPDFAEIMYIMGQCNEKIGKKDQAAAFYKKILSMNITDNDGMIYKVKQALDALGV